MLITVGKDADARNFTAFVNGFRVREVQAGTMRNQRIQIDDSSVLLPQESGISTEVLEVTIPYRNAHDLIARVKGVGFAAGMVVQRSEVGFLAVPPQKSVDSLVSPKGLPTR